MADEDKPGNVPKRPPAPRGPAAPTADLEPLLDTQTEATTPRRWRVGAIDATFAPGQVLADRYRIVRFIAQGGMGEVYEAEDRELGERVALKTVRPEVAGQEGALERFKREVQLARKVTHPNVCRLFDLGVHRFGGPDGETIEVRYLTMELLEGETLAQRLKRVGRMSPAEALPIVRQVAAALGTAHDAGIVHRDFKSSNVMLVSGREGERAVVTDFGLAHGIADGASLEASLTATGSSLGTPAYMAPEQVAGKRAGPGADIYALGVVIYEMVTGLWPFTGGTPMSIAVKRLTEKPPPPRLVVADLDPAWEAAILRCLQKEPADRFAAATDVVDALEGKAVSPSRRTRRLRVAALAAAATVLVALAVLAGMLLRDRWRTGAPPGGTARRPVAVLGFRNLGRPDAAWLSTAVSEMLRTELAAGEKVRTIPGENVARMKVELALADADSLARDTLARVRSNLGADIVVLGSYLSLGPGGRLRLDARIQDTASGEILASAAEEATEEEVFGLVSRVGERLREALALGEMTAEQAGAVRASMPRDPQAARLFAEGLARLRLSDALAARERLEKAVAAEPGHALSRAALARAWRALGYDQKAREEAARALELAKDLSRDDRLRVEAFYRQASGEWDKAVEIRRSLALFYPESVDDGLGLAATLTEAGRGQDALVEIEALRKLPAPASDDPRIDLAEAEAAKALTDFTRQQRAAARAATKAQALGARLLYAQARLLEGTALVDQGAAFDAARASLDEARRIFEEAGDRAGVARAANMIAIGFQAKKGDRPGARRAFEEALSVYREIGDQRGIVRQLGNLGNVEADEGKAEAARELFQEALDISRDIGDRSATARMLNNVGTLLWQKNDLEGARRAFEEAARTYESLGESRSVAAALSNLGEVLHRQGQLDLARRRFEAALEICRKLAIPEDTALTLVPFGRLLADRGDLAGARKLLEEALRIDRGLEDGEGTAEALGALASVAERAGDKDGARRLRSEAAAATKPAGRKP
jgi:eukaryotic-like serine/threonine-protein kinase